MFKLRPDPEWRNDKLTALLPVLDLAQTFKLYQGFPEPKRCEYGAPATLDGPLGDIYLVWFQDRVDVCCVKSHAGIELDFLIYKFLIIHTPSFLTFPHGTTTGTPRTEIKWFLGLPLPAIKTYPCFPWYGRWLFDLRYQIWMRWPGVGLRITASPPGQSPWQSNQQPRLDQKMQISTACSHLHAP
jgi:hypothetical protein